jgi:long-chain acyl-CoA synthetase
MLDHRALCWSVERLREYLPFTHEDRVILFLPPWHIAERMVQLLTISLGASMAVSSVATLVRDFPAAEPTLMLSVPRVWENVHRKIQDRVRDLRGPASLLVRAAIRAAETHRDQIDRLRGRFTATGPAEAARDRRRRLAAAVAVPFTFLLDLPARRVLRRIRSAFGPRFRYAMSGGGAVPREVVRFFRSLHLPILDAYGMTETTALGAMGEPLYPKRGAIGPVFPGCEIELRDEAGRPIEEPGVIGVAWHRGPHVTRGYYRNPEATARDRVDGWLDSGDLMMWTTTGELRFAGRAKDTIVLRSGENVEPAPIEMAITESGYASHVVVVGQDRKSLVALIVPDWTAVEKELSRRGVAIDAPREHWNRTPALRDFFAAVVREAVSSDRGFKPHERVRDFTLLAEEFRPGHEMTHTLKIKRKDVLERYAAEIEEMYRRPASSPLPPPVPRKGVGQRP